MSEKLRVLELGTGVASAYAAKLLGDFGADVIKVESPDGDPARLRGPFPDDVVDPENSGVFLALNLNKRGVTLDVNDPNCRDQLHRLIRWAHILVHSYSPSEAAELGVDTDSVAARHPQLVVLSMTPFGQIGPYCDYRAEELTVTNAGGWANVCPGTHTDIELPPLKVFGDQCALMSGIAGAMVALATAREAARSGVGEYIDFSLQEYVASVLESGIPAFSYKGVVAARNQQRRLIPWRIFNAKDAPVFLVCVEQDQWERLVEFMGHPDWTDLEVFSDQDQRVENQDMVHTFVQEFVSQWHAMDLYHAAQKQRICLAPVMSMDQFAGNEHLQDRGFFVDVSRDGGEPTTYLGASVVTTQGRAPVKRPAPMLGQHNGELQRLAVNAFDAASTTRGVRPPLHGVRVLDMTWAWAGPFCSMNLAHLGAEVIRVESELRADLYRRLQYYPEDRERTLNSSGMFNQWNQGKSSIAVDLSRPEGIQLVKDLVVTSDVVVQNFATGVLDRMGLGYAELLELNPGIILASISGYGQTGPYREYMGYGPAIPPLTGLAAATGYVGGDPEEIGLSMPDPTAGITAALAVVEALFRRDQTGKGDHLDVSLWEATGVLNFEGWMGYAFNGTQPERAGNRSHYMSPHGVFRCAGENAWVSIACRDDDEWRALADSIDPALAADARFGSLQDRKLNEAELESLVTAWTRDRDRWEVARQLQAKSIAAFPTFTSQDIVEDPHLNERAFIERLNHPEVGARAHAGIPWRMNNRPSGVSKPAPCLGADTDAHLKEILKLTDEAILRLREEGVIGC